jgi:hypothetical protein
MATSGEEYIHLLVDQVCNYRIDGMIAQSLIATAT